MRAFPAYVFSAGRGLFFACTVLSAAAAAAAERLVPDVATLCVAKEK